MCMVAVRDKNNSVVCGRMLAGKIPASWQRIRNGFSKTPPSYKMSISQNQVQLLFCHARKMGKSYVLASEIIFVVLMLKRVREKLH